MPLLLCFIPPMTSTLYCSPGIFPLLSNGNTTICPLAYSSYGLIYQSRFTKRLSYLYKQHHVFRRRRYQIFSRLNISLVAYPFCADMLPAHRQTKRKLSALSHGVYLYLLLHVGYFVYKP